MHAFFTKYALAIKISALTLAAVAIVGGVSVYATIRSAGQGEEENAPETVEYSSHAQVREPETEETTTQGPEEEPATYAKPSYDHDRISQEIADKAEHVSAPSKEELVFTPEKDQEQKEQDNHGDPVDVEEQQPPKPEEQAPSFIGGSVKYEIYRTLEGSGYAPAMKTEWTSTEQYYNDGQPVASWRGIDVSYAQGDIDFEAVKAAGIDFVIIRVGARGYGSGDFIPDQYFDQNIEAASKAGLDIGVYFYTQAITEEEAIAEAKFVLQKLGEHPNVEITYPVIMDVEGSDGYRIMEISDEQLNRNVTAFCEVIRQAGYYPMIYADQNFGEYKLDFSSLPYDYWMACYRTQNTSFALWVPFTMWQYTSSGSVAGVSGNVDLDVSLVDYATYLRSKGWNKLSGGASEPETVESTTQPDVPDEIPSQVRKIESEA
ncbi:MAG: glycoside hydrolase family 25 protein [Clostridia bacterium]